MHQIAKYVPFGQLMAITVAMNLAHMSEVLTAVENFFYESALLVTASDHISGKIAP
jgi:hypothetical protein